MQAFCLDDFKSLAKDILPEMVFEYVASGAGDEHTLAWNLEAFARIKLLPRVLRDVTKTDTSITLFGKTFPHPIFVAPTAYHKLLHSEGELATAKGANAAAAVYVISSYTTTPLEKIRASSEGPFWFQLYLQDDRDSTRDLVELAEESGCQAICLTVDTPVSGTRNRQQRAGFSLPDGIKAPYIFDKTTGIKGRSIQLKKPLTWTEVEWLKSFIKVPLLLKGILNPLDAKMAVDAGISGIIVSNHGGRNLDTVPATIDALPGIAEAVRGRVPVLLDGGIRRGTDVLKAIALGADAIMVGQPLCFALASGGAEGVEKALNILKTEFEMAMALCGATQIKDIDRSLLFS